MRTSGIAVWLKIVTLLAMLTSTTCRHPVRHLVGGEDHWKPNVNYTNWSLNKTFYAGDWLYFMYDKYMFNVLEVNKTSYDNCTDQGFIFNITRGAGRDVFELKKPKSYYFLSSGGYCYNGMKLGVNVIEFVSAPEPSYVTSSISSNMVTGINMVISSFVIAVLWVALL
uniref:lamin-like protein n=1 Tax=Erigeron canadensis TaxID=72917 RepID=UPI001CB957F3|nr:lamin-like protein [Erigeron canadensis]